MNCKNAPRIISVIINVLLLCAGSAVSAFAPSTEDAGTMASVFAAVLCGIMIIVLIIECVTAFKIYDSSLHTAAVALFLLMFMLFSPDMRMFYLRKGAQTDGYLFDFLDYLFFIGVGLSLAMFFRHTYRPDGKRVIIYPLFVCGIISFALYVVLKPLGIQYAALYLFVATLAGWYIKMRYLAYRRGLENAAFYFSSAIYASAAGMQSVNTLYYCGIFPGCLGWSIAYCWIIIFCFSVIYLVYFLRNEGAAIELGEYRLQNENLKMKVLIGQIKPHFIFNALTTIKSSYHTNIAEGDSALELFSEYMRNSLSLIDTEIIPLEKELANISRYIEFINKSQTSPFNIIFNVEESDFLIPAFSLQPFIENAVKYSKVNLKPDGYIMISSVADDKFAKIRITDNGVGFDASEIAEGAHGINNSKERLRLLFGTQPTIKSKIDCGTEITIRLKRMREEDKK